MISILGDYTYDFPKKLTLKHKLKDLLDKNVDEKYYLSQKMINCFMSDGTGSYPRRERFIQNIERVNQDIGNAITTLAGNRATDNFVVEEYGNKRLNETLESNNVKDGDFIDAYNKTVNSELAGTITTRVSDSNNTFIANEEQTLKQELCNKLIEYGLVKEGDIVKHSYTAQIMSGNKKCVEKSDEMITLTTRGDCVGVCVDAYSESERKLFTEDGNIKRYLGSDIIDKFEEGQMATTTFPNGYGHGSRVHNESITLNTIDRPSVKQNLRIRKLTPCECIKLMGFERKDYESLVEYGLSDSAIYHCAGDSIVATVLVGLFGTMTNKDYEQIIKDYAERITND